MKNMKIIIALLLGATGSAALPIPKTVALSIARTAAKHSAAAAVAGPKKAFALDQIVVPLKQDDALPATIAVGEIRTKLPGFLAESKHDVIKRRLEQADYKLIKSGAECNSGDASLGSFGTVKGCADKCAQTEGCRFFISGIAGSQGDKTGSCFHEKTSDGTCTEGWDSDSYDFYELSTAMLIKSGAECKSDDAWLGSFDTVKGCADKCAQAGDCRYFIYGIYGDGGAATPTGGDKTGQCWHEKTSDATCSEGWDSDSFDFYESIATTKCAAPKYVMDNKCEDCPDGSTCDGAAATKCAATNYVLNNVCTACPSGYTCDGAKATCAATKYVGRTRARRTGTWSNVCKDCPADHTCDGTTATKCDAPKYVDSNVCTERKYATAAERADCLADGGSCGKCCPGITCYHLKEYGSGRFGLNQITLTDVDDCVFLEGNYNNVDGHGGDDAIVVVGDYNRLHAGDGDDAIVVVSGDGNFLKGGDDNDKLTVVKGHSNYLYGDNGDDAVTVVKGNSNFLWGDKGDDTLTVEAGHSNSGNTLYGGAGTDTFKVLGVETQGSKEIGYKNHTNQGSTPLIVGLCVGAAVLVLGLAVVVRKLRGRAAEETSAIPQLDTEVQLEA